MRRIPRPIAIAGYTAAAILIAAGGVMFAQSAGAVPIDDGDGVFTLDATPYPFSHTDFSPGSREEWLIDAINGGADAAALTLQLSYSGVLATDPDGLDLSVHECSVAWAGAPSTCGGTETVLYDGPYASAPTGVQDLGTIGGGVTRHYLAVFSLAADTPDTMQGQEANFAFSFTASNDTETVTNLPRTGVPDLLAPIMLAAGLVLAGLILARQRAGAAAEAVRADVTAQEVSR
jgi:hypothetical protein